MTEIAELRCKNCGGALNIDEAEGGVIKCKYCHSLFAVNKKETLPEAVAQLRIAENELDNNAFDRALTAYRRAAEIDGNEPQAYYGMALARHKVQYLKAVKDSSGERVSYLQPICHEYEGTSFTSDESYKRALELATDRQRAYYESKGEEIDYIAREFERLAIGGLDYDSFICVKVTDDSTGLRTLDCKDADDIYYYLKRKGYKPFFSETEIGKKSGADYEAHILYALYKAECMVVVCHDEKYLETAWVKNEYTRFLNLIRSDRKDHDAVTIAFSGKVIERLPGRSGRLQGIDLRRGDSLEKIRDFVESHTPEARAKREEEKERKAHESERVKRETEELKKKLEEQQREFEERNRKLQEQLEELARAKKEETAKTVDVSGLSGEEMLDIMERAQREREEKARREKEALEAAERARKAEEAQRQAKRAAEERKRIEEEIRINQEERAKQLIREQEERERRAKIIEEDPMLENDLYDKYIFNIEGTVLKKYTGKKASVKIPKGVTCVEFRAFENLPLLKSLTIPESVIEINNYAFYQSSELSKIHYEGNLEKWCGIAIASNAFERSYDLYIDGRILSKAVIPDGVEKIRSNAFANCASLESVELPQSVKNIGDSSFKGCAFLKSIVIREGITEIGIGAFSDCASLKRIFIPSTVKKIKSYAFSDCNALSRVDYGGDIDGWSNIIIDGGYEKKNKYGGIDYSPYIEANPLTYGHDLYINGKFVEKIVLNDDVGWFSFCGSSIKDVTVADGVNKIGKGAFYNCINLQKLSMAGSVNTIGEMSFANCPLEEVRSNVEILQDLLPMVWHRDSMDFLKFVVIERGETIKSSLFDRQYLYADSNTSSIESIILPEGLLNIEAEAFKNSVKLKKIVIPETVKSIGSGAFYNCQSLKEITIPDNVEFIGDSAFVGCSSLETVKISKRNKRIIKNSKIFRGSVFPVIWNPHAVGVKVDERKHIKFIFT